MRKRKTSNPPPLKVNEIFRQLKHRRPRPFYLVRRVDRQGNFWYILMLPLKDPKGELFYYHWGETDKMIYLQGEPIVSQSLAEVQHMGWEFTEEILQKSSKIRFVPG